MCVLVLKLLRPDTMICLAAYLVACGVDIYSKHRLAQLLDQGGRIIDL